MTKLHRIALSCSLFLPLLASCVDPDEPELGETSDELTFQGSTETGFFGPVVPSAFRGDNFKVQVAGANASGAIAWDIQEEAGYWSWPQPNIVGGYPIAGTQVTAVQQEDGKTVVFTNWGGWLTRSTQTVAYSRGSWNWWVTVEQMADVAPSFARNADGRLEGVYVAYNGHVKQIWQQSVNGAWSAPYDTGIVTTGAPKILRDAQNRLEIMVPIATGSCGVKYWRQWAPNGWSGWTVPQLAAGACVKNVAGAYVNGSTEVLAQSTSGAIHRFTRPTTNAQFNRSVETFSSTAGPVSPPTITVKDDGRVLAFTAVRTCAAPNVCGKIYFNERFGGATWGGWTLLSYAAEASSIATAESWINDTQAFIRLVSLTNEYNRAKLY